ALPRVPHELPEDSATLGQRDDRHPEIGAEVQEVPEDLLRFEDFGHGEHRSELAGGESSCEVPVSVVPQSRHDAPARGERLAHRAVTHQAHACGDLLAGEPGQLEHFAVVPQVGAHALAGQASQSGAVELGPYPGEIGFELGHPAVAQQPGPVGHGCEDAARHRVGDPFHDTPRQREDADQVDHHAPVLPCDCRCTAETRWMTVHALATASRTRATARITNGRPSPTSSTATRMTTSRSARSASPPSAVIPSEAARAFAYGTMLPRTRQLSASAAVTSPAAPSTCRRAQIPTPAKIAASAKRSIVES